MMTLRDAYEMGRYVTRHPGTQGSRDRHSEYLAMYDYRYSEPLYLAYWLGRDRFARTGEY